MKIHKKAGETSEYFSILWIQFILKNSFLSSVVLFQKLSAITQYKRTKYPFFLKLKFNIFKILIDQKILKKKTRKNPKLMISISVLLVSFFQNLQSKDAVKFADHQYLT